MAEKPSYLLGSEERQAWMQKYYFAPRGYGFSEPGIVALDSKQMSAYNIAKSTYQIYPDVYNMKRICKMTGIKKEEAVARLKRMYEEKLIMLVQNPATEVCGWGLWYWVVKLKEGASPAQKQQLIDWYQEKDDICTGYKMSDGDFDFFNGNHMRVLDNLLSDVIGPWKDNECVEYVHLCPISRDVRESNVNMWDAPGDGYRKHVWGKKQIDLLMKTQDKIDAIDFAIIDAINSAESVGEMFDYDRLAQLSGLDANEMKRDFCDICDNKRIIVPLLHLNHMKLGLTHKFYTVRMFQITPSYRRHEIVDELAAIPEFNNIWMFADSFYDICLTAYNELSDTDALRKKLESYAEVEEVKEANSDRMFRRWVCRLDDQNGYWEECIFTDDFLQDRTAAAPLKCSLSCEGGRVNK